ncbi:helix-turn-helix domain-containing protein [Sinorhizobium garamanticum]|uniref:Helix-turn-helix domain-containing protein n=1 Tax=Sinorhizobium garamanticum TaxID=680247 RepID=A0ABY8DEW2_9HYPH|nr:helix-turn-helix domain-containing protein [Sinorhizobium garamanticum]WEX89436.1 helix-turn-helix domain-containing protein [Sinorhizobium garamanticum]
MRRLWIKMTQVTLAKALGITFQQLQKYENGTNRVGASRLQAIAKVLGVAPSYFFDGMPGRQPGESAKAIPHNELTGFLSSEDGLALNRAFERIRDAKIRKRFVSLVETLAAQA